MTDQEWREQLKVGDEVAVRRWSEYELRTVEYVTKRYVDVGGLRFRRDTGAISGGSGYSNMAIERPTDVVRDSLRRRGAVEALERFCVTDAVPTERIERAVAILKGGD